MSATASTDSSAKQALQRENDQYQAALSVMQQRVSALESSLREEKDSHAREADQLRAVNAQLQDELYAAHGDREGLETELQQLRAHFAQLEDSIHRLSEREQQLGEEHAQATMRLAQQERAFQEKLLALQARSDATHHVPLAMQASAFQHVGANHHIASLTANGPDATRGSADNHRIAHSSSLWSTSTTTTANAATASSSLGGKHAA